jgi:hypothetical protein
LCDFNYFLKLFIRAQLIFRTALLEPELELKIIRNMRKPPVPPKPTSFRSNNKTRSTLLEINQNNDLSFVDHDSNMNSLNTRRLGKIIKIALVKGEKSRINHKSAGQNGDIEHGVHSEI